MAKNVLKALEDATGLKAAKKQDRQEYLKALVAAVNDLSEQDWGELPEESQEWFNAAAVAVKGKKDVEDVGAPAAVGKPDKKANDEDADDEDADDEDADDEDADDEDADDEDADDEDADDEADDEDVVKKNVVKAKKTAAKSVEAKPAKAKKDGEAKRPRVFGKYSVGAFVRWLGRKDVDFDGAVRVLKRLGVEGALSDASVKWELKERREGHDPAKLSKEEVATVKEKCPKVFA